MFKAIRGFTLEIVRIYTLNICQYFMKHMYKYGQYRTLSLKQDLIGSRISPRGREGGVTFHFPACSGDSIVKRDFTTQRNSLACFRDLNVTCRITPSSRVYIARLPSSYVILFSCGAHYFS